MGALIGDTAATRLNDIERRLETLERTSSLAVSSIRDGTLTLQDPNGVGVVVLGKQADGTHGISVQNVNGRVLFKVTSERGQAVPQTVVPMVFGQSSGPAGAPLLSGTLPQPVGFRPGTGSGSWQTLWHGYFLSTGSSVDYSIVAYANAGSMNWRIGVCEVGGTPQIVVGPNAETTNVIRSGTFAIPTSALLAGTDPAGRLMFLSFDAQYVSGTSTVDMLIANAPVNHT